jgi:hypothetical protein
LAILRRFILFHFKGGAAGHCFEIAIQGPFHPSLVYLGKVGCEKNIFK